MDNRENDKIEDSSTFKTEDDNSFEVKESFFEKIKGIFTRPRLTSGNNVKTTNMSFSSWSMRAVFRRALESVSNSVSNIISKKEPEIKNQFATTVIGKDDNIQNSEITRESVDDQTVTRVIPKVKSKNVQQAPKGIIDNSKSAKDIEYEHNESGIEVVDIKVDDIDLNQEKTNKPKEVIPGIEVADITVNDGKNSKENNLEDTRE